MLHFALKQVGKCAEPTVWVRAGTVGKIGRPRLLVGWAKVVKKHKRVHVFQHFARENPAHCHRGGERRFVRGNLLLNGSLHGV
jgi:hypothetical protein